MELGKVAAGTPASPWSAADDEEGGWVYRARPGGRTATVVSRRSSVGRQSSFFRCDAGGLGAEDFGREIEASRRLPKNARYASWKLPPAISASSEVAQQLLSSCSGSCGRFGPFVGRCLCQICVYLFNQKHNSCWPMCVPNVAKFGPNSANAGRTRRGFGRIWRTWAKEHARCTFLVAPRHPDKDGHGDGGLCCRDGADAGLGVRHERPVCAGGHLRETRRSPGRAGSPTMPSMRWCRA